MFDFSKYPDNSRFYHVKNTKVIGKMKNETKCVHVDELAGLKSKLYSYIKEDNEGGMMHEEYRYTKRI